jgi:hypothetical protein
MDISAAFIKVLKGDDPDFTIEKFLQTYDPAFGHNFMLTEAAAANNLHMVAVMLADSRVDPAYNDNSAIKMAAMYGFYDVVKLLLADPRVIMDNRNNILGTAIINGRMNVTQLLLDSPKVNPMSNITEHIKGAITFRHVDVLDMLLKHVGDKLQNYMVRGMLAHAVGVYYEPAVVDVLLDCPQVDPSENDNHALRLMCEMDVDINLIRKLLKDNRVDATCGLGSAIRLKKYDLVELLLSHAENRRELINVFLDLQGTPPTIAAAIADRIFYLHYCPFDRTLWSTRASLLRMTAERDELAGRLQDIKDALAE